MNRLKPCVLLLIFFLSCTKTPKNIIPKDEMIRVLADVHLANASANYSDLDTIKQRTSTYLNAVYNRYHIDSAKFNRSLKYYSESPELLNEMYNTVDKDLAKKADSLMKLEEMERKRQAAIEEKRARLKQDSLKRIQNELKENSIRLLKPVVPAIWPFKEYQFKINRSIKRK